MSADILPAIPTRLLRSAYSKGKLVPWVGAGLSSAILGQGSAGRLPGYRGIIEYLCEEALTAGLIDAAQAASVNDALDANDFLAAAASVRASIPTSQFSQMMWKRLSIERPKTSQHHLMLNLMQFPIYLTTNYDWVLDDIVRPRPKVLTYRDHETLEALVADELSAPGESPFVFKLNGDLSAPSTIVLGQAQKIGLYDKETELGRALRAAIKTLMSQCSILFLGYSFDAPSYRKMILELGEELGSECQPHFAVLPKNEVKKIPELDDLSRKSRLSVFSFELDKNPPDGDEYRELWQFLSQIPESDGHASLTIAPESVNRSFFLVKRRPEYLEMQNAFEARSTGFRFLTPTLTNALATPDFLDKKSPETLEKFKGKEGIGDWAKWKDDVIDQMKMRAATFRHRMDNGAEARILCFEEDTLAAVKKLSTEKDRVSLARYRLCMDLHDIEHQDIEVRFIPGTSESRSLMSYASLIRLNSNLTTDVAVAYASQATTSEFDAHVFEVNTEFSRDMLAIFEREWARSLSLNESLAKLRNALRIAEERFID